MKKMAVKRKNDDDTIEIDAISISTSIALRVKHIKHHIVLSKIDSLKKVKSFDTLIKMYHSGFLFVLYILKTLIWTRDIDVGYTATKY